MTWHESDLSLEEKYNLLKKMEDSLELQLSTVRHFQIGINNLKMTAKQEMSVIKVGEESKIVTKHYSPKDNAGNDMDEDYRTSQKESLIINIDNFLNEG